MRVGGSDCAIRVEGYAGAKDSAGDQSDCCQSRWTGARAQLVLCTVCTVQRWGTPV